VGVSGQKPQPPEANGVLGGSPKRWAIFSIKITHFLAYLGLNSPFKGEQVFSPKQGRRQRKMSGGGGTKRKKLKPMAIISIGFGKRNAA